MTYLMVKTGTKTILFSFKRKFIRYHITKLFYKVKDYEVKGVRI